MAMESSMTSGVRVASAGAVLVALLLGPKITKAVAAPTVGASHPVVARLLAALPHERTSQIVAEKVQVEAPVAALTPEAKSSAKLGGSAPISGAASTAQVNVAPLVSPEVELNVEVSPRMVSPLKRFTSEIGRAPERS